MPHFSAAAIRIKLYPMNYRDIIDKIKGFPIVRKKGTDFREHLFQELDNYNQHINKLDDNKRLIDKVNKLSSGIKKTLNAYYEGNQSKAYRILSTTLKYTELTTFLNKDSILPEGFNLYRIRIKDSNYPVSRKEIFHIPFNLR